jgi:hypothetical protein
MAPHFLLIKIIAFDHCPSASVMVELFAIVQSAILAAKPIRDTISGEEGFAQLSEFRILVIARLSLCVKFMRVTISPPSKFN